MPNEGFDNTHSSDGGPVYLNVRIRCSSLFTTVDIYAANRHRAPQTKYLICHLLLADFSTSYSLTSMSEPKLSDWASAQVYTAKTNCVKIESKISSLPVASNIPDWICMDAFCLYPFFIQHAHGHAGGPFLFSPFPVRAAIVNFNCGTFSIQMPANLLLRHKNYDRVHCKDVLAPHSNKSLIIVFHWCGSKNGSKVRWMESGRTRTNEQTHNAIEMNIFCVSFAAVLHFWIGART